MNTNTDNLDQFDRTEKPGLFWEICAGVLYGILLAGNWIFNKALWFWRLDLAAKGLVVYFLLCAAMFIAGIVMFFLP